jgi:multidrug efflux system outer membrane protein
MKTSRLNTVLAPLAVVLLLAGCASLAPEYQQPTLELPAAADAAPLPAVGERWWTRGSDRELAALIDEALAHNSDLLIAASRIEQARAALTLARSDETPSLLLRGGASRSRDPVPDPRIVEKYSVQLAAAWELDFWGRYRDATVAAREQLLASEANREALRLSLASQVAQSWYGWQALQQRVALQERTLAAQQQELALYGRRVDSGLGGDFELHQLEAEVAGTTSTLQQLIAARDRERNALGILLGRTPKALVEASLPTTGTIVVTAGPVGLPAELPTALPSTRLLARPDVQAAEAGLRAANARIGVARAAWFPAITLTASGGTVSAELSGLFSGGTGAFAFAAALAAPLFDSGRIASGIDSAKAEREAAEQIYRQTVARAFRDVLDALVARRAAKQTAQAETARVAALQETVRLARLRYEHGLIGLYELLGFERGLLAAQSTLVDARRAEAAAAVQLWTAIGG